MLAQLSDVNPSTLRDVLAIIAFLIGSAVGVRSLMGGKKETEREKVRDTTDADLAAVRDRVAKIEAVVDQMRTEAKADRDQVRLEAKADRESIVQQLHQLELRLMADADRRDRNTQARINDLVSTVSRLSGQVDGKGAVPAVAAAPPAA